MIYITGDCHGEYRRFNTDIFPEQKEMTKKDYVIICGDFGFWDNSKEQSYWRKWLEQKTFTTLWVDGNHENFDLLKCYEIKEWHGGKVQFLNSSIIHLMRGQVYEIENKKIFTFGGARSHDISGGILNIEEKGFKRKKKMLDKEKKSYRINHISWWKEEMPLDEELQEAEKNLKSVDYCIDYIISHCCPFSIQQKILESFIEPDKLTSYFEELKNKCQYKNWIFGHYHDNQKIEEKFLLLYEQIIRLV